MRYVVDAADARKEWGKLVVAEERARILSSQMARVDYHMRRWVHDSFNQVRGICLHVSRSDKRLEGWVIHLK